MEWLILLFVVIVGVILGHALLGGAVTLEEPRLLDGRKESKPNRTESMGPR